MPVRKIIDMHKSFLTLCNKIFQKECKTNIAKLDNKIPEDYF